jgi:hypothetical protein
MKRTFLIAGILACVIFLFTGMHETGNSAQLITCEQFFHVVDQNGTPQSGCDVFGTGAALNCTTDDNGNYSWIVEQGMYIQFL